MELETDIGTPKPMEDIITANEKLNERCGTQGINYYEGIEALGFLFKYVVPKLPNYVIQFYPTKVNPTDEYVTWYAIVGLRDTAGIHKEDKDPALALFWVLCWALWEATPT